MNTSVKKVTRLKFVDALATAQAVFKTKHPRTKLAYYCEQFVELNKDVSKSHNKEAKAITGPLELELNSYRIDKAAEKDSVLLMDNIPDGKGGVVTKYKFSKENEKLVYKKEEEIRGKIEAKVDEFLAQEIEVKCIVDEMKLPDNIEYDVEKSLNGFVFQNKNEFEKESETTA